MKEIPLTQGYVAIVDDEDYERVSEHNWVAQAVPRADGSVRIYAIRTFWKTRESSTSQRLHRFILNPQKEQYVDHVNGNPLDNRRVNIRICTDTENSRNARARTDGTSKFKGVHWNKQGAKWRASIRVNGKLKHLGCFTSEIDAAHAYDAAALKCFGEFARINTYGAQDE